MSTEANKILLQRFYDEVWNQFSLDVIEEIFAADYSTPNAPPWRKPGVEGLREFIKDNYRMFPDLKFQVDDLVAEGDKVAVRFSGTGAHKGDLTGPVGLVPATNRKVTWRGLTIFTFKDGKIVEAVGITDNMELMQQLGAIQPSNTIG